MAHMSLQAEDCRIYIKNGKLRFQAMRHDMQGELQDQVTITLPVELAHKFAAVENMDDAFEPVEEEIDFFNRIRNLIVEDPQD